MLLFRRKLRRRLYILLLLLLLWRWSRHEYTYTYSIKKKSLKKNYQIVRAVAAACPPPFRADFLRRHRLYSVIMEVEHITQLRDGVIIYL